MSTTGELPVTYYNRRDLIGHWIRKEQRTQKPCTHACCRGYRVHPENYPVILPSRTLRRATDQDLADHFSNVSTMEGAKARRAEAQLIYEMERRDRADLEREQRQVARAERQRQHREGVEAGRAARRMEREAETERIYLEAEEFTRGNWTNRKGTARGISDREILTGREDVFRRYASEEAREYFQSHPGRPPRTSRGRMPGCMSGTRSGRRAARHAAVRRPPAVTHGTMLSKAAAPHRR